LLVNWGQNTQIQSQRLEWKYQWTLGQTIDFDKGEITWN
jgi:hypothetical protein